MHTPVVKSNLKLTTSLPLLILFAFSMNSIFSNFVAASFHSSRTGTERITPYSMNEHDNLRQAVIAEACGKLPLSFEVNQGQADARVRFLSRGNGYDLFLTPTELVLTLQAPTAQETGTKSSTTPTVTYIRSLTGGGHTQQDVMRMKLVGANPSTHVTGLEEFCPGKSNYFLGSDPKQWHTNIPHYSRVKHEDLYPGVDLIY